ncbi:serine hydrolase [Undibacterium fentianense]|uniref:Beta-lactamase family protein n=1 Tax=Undibacterium fentianense TaxID=2828728 RepID=A0A941IBX1_9BURK|nr:serine hydrolase domain-containing protein [Undibacterium fentianense]MBR7799549.1 beta-lactamase family protein [Undibacterium fentianense]
MNRNFEPVTSNKVRNKKKTWLSRCGMLILSFLATACGGAGGSVSPVSGANATSGSASSGGSTSNSNTGTDTCSVSKLESEMNTQLAQLQTDTDFSFGIEREDGRRYWFQRGASTMRTPYESASTSKMVSALIILRLVEQGYLKLEDKPQDKIANWPIPSTVPLSTMSLANLLSFTSGLTEEPLCLNAGFSNFESCVNNIAVVNANNTLIPGTEFYYASTHLQVAGLMAVKARGVNSWQELFKEFQQQTGLFKTASYDLPSSSNPRLAGGMHWTGEEYLEFLVALKKGKLLNSNSMAQLLVDRTASTKLTYSPATALGEVWHYGLGMWHECQNSSFSCAPASRISSPGAYGAYPFWDRNKSYIGILARQGELGSFTKGVAVERAIRPKVETWLTCLNQ